jgi:hypothetical protein
VALTTSLATTGAFRYTDMVAGRIVLPSVANTSLTFYECDTINGTYVLCDDVGTNGVLTVPTAAAAGKAVGIPTVLLGSAFIKMVANVGAVTATVITKTA